MKLNIEYGFTVIIIMSSVFAAIGFLVLILDRIGQRKLQKQRGR